MKLKLTVLGCLLAMSAGVAVASSLRESSAEHLAGDEGGGSGLMPHPASSSSTAEAAGSHRPHPVAGGFEAPGLHGLQPQTPNAPLPPSWQSLLPGTIRL